MRSTRLVLCAALLALVACKKDPNDIRGPLKTLKDGKSEKARLKALERLRKIGRKDSAPGLVEALGTASPRLKGDIAVVLAELKAPEASKALVPALDVAVREGDSKEIRDIELANQKIARALGDLGDQSAAGPLLQLVRSSKNENTRIEAIGSLGRLGDAGAVSALSEIALDEQQSPWVNKKALEALGAINRPEALSTYLKMLYIERAGASYYPDASFGLFRLGPTAHDAALALLNGQDKETLAVAKKQKIPPAAVLAKAAQVAGDLQDPRAVPVLAKLLTYKAEDPDHRAFVVNAVADALGRMRARGAAPVLAERMGAEEERTPFVTALARIGERSVLPKVAACAGAGVWFSREICMKGLVLLGTAKDAKLFDGFAKEEPGRFAKECKAGDYGDDVDCAKEKEKTLADRTKSMKAYQEALEKVGGCPDLACLAEASEKQPEPIARERAIYLLGHSAKVEALPPLLAAARRPVKEQADLFPRIAAILAAEWLVAANAEVQQKAKPEIAALRTQIDQDARGTLTEESAQEMKRLVDIIERGRATKGSAAEAKVDADEPSDEEKPPPKKAPAKKPAGKKKKGKR